MEQNNIYDIIYYSMKSGRNKKWLLVSSYWQKTQFIPYTRT